MSLHCESLPSDLESLIRDLEGPSGHTDWNVGNPPYITEPSTVSGLKQGSGLPVDRNHEITSGLREKESFD